MKLNAATHFRPHRLHPAGQRAACGTPAAVGQRAVLALLAWRAYLTWSGNPLPRAGCCSLITVACVTGHRHHFPHAVRARGRRHAADPARHAQAAGAARGARCHGADLPVLLHHHHQFLLLAEHPHRAVHAVHLAGHHGDLGASADRHISHSSRACASPPCCCCKPSRCRSSSSCCSRACRDRCGACRRMPMPAAACPTRMAPGSMSRLSLSDAVAFRVTFNDKVPAREQMYWRGPVLWDFDGTTWTRGRNATLQQPAARRCQHAGGLHGDAGAAQQTLAVRAGHADEDFHPRRPCAGFPVAAAERR